MAETSSFFELTLTYFLGLNLKVCLWCSVDIWGQMKCPSYQPSYVMIRTTLPVDCVLLELFLLYCTYQKLPFLTPGIISRVMVCSTAQYLLSVRISKILVELFSCPTYRYMGYPFPEGKRPLKWNITKVTASEILFSHFFLISDKPTCFC